MKLPVTNSALLDGFDPFASAASSTVPWAPEAKISPLVLTLISGTSLVPKIVTVRVAESGVLNPSVAE